MFIDGSSGGSDNLVSSFIPFDSPMYTWVLFLFVIGEVGQSLVFLLCLLKRTSIYNFSFLEL